MKILLLASAFNGLTQRVWLDLRRAGHWVSVELGTDPEAMHEAAVLAAPDLIICPFLRQRVPATVWRRWRTIIIHPGPKGDRGPSSLDWAITEGARQWGVTALQAAEEMDAGDVWATRTFTVPTAPDGGPPRKSSLYAGPVADAAVGLVREVVARAADPAFVPEPVQPAAAGLPGRPRPVLRQDDRAFGWDEPADRVLRAVRAADGSPGVRAELCGLTVHVYDAHPGRPTPGRPGTVAARRHGAVLVRTGGGDTGLWIGHLRSAPIPGAAGTVKRPATALLGGLLDGVPADGGGALDVRGLDVGGLDVGGLDVGGLDGGGLDGGGLDVGGLDRGEPGYSEIGYRRDGDIGVLSMDVYNGALSTDRCRRLAVAVRHALRQDTRVLVLRGGEAFCNGIDLNEIEAAADPAVEAWRNIVGIDAVCRDLISATGQLVLAAVGGGAGAGGGMLALGADLVVVRDGVLVNPHYRTMGLHGSEYWTYTLPRRVGRNQASQLTDACLPVDAEEAVRLGLADRLLPAGRAAFDAEVLDVARSLVAGAAAGRMLARKRARLEADAARKPLDAYLAEELAEMSRDLFDDRTGFDDLRRAFVTKRPPVSTPSRLARHRPVLGPRLPRARLAPDVIPLPR